MPFPHPLTSTELTLLRDNDDYEAHVNLAYCPQTVVFQASLVDAPVTTVFASVTFDSVTTGAYTDIKEGQTVYIGLTGSLRFPRLVTRVRKAATSDTLYIGESSDVLQPGDIITVVDDYTLHEKLGRVLVDGSIKADWELAFHKPAPLIGGLQSAYIDPRKTGDGTFTFSPVLQLPAYGATAGTWVWDVSDGTITVGSSSTQRMTATFPQGQRWIRVTHTDSNGVSNYRVIWVNVGLTNTIENIEDPSTNGSIDDGWTVSLNTWEFASTVLRTLPNNTLCVLYTTEIFGDGSTSAIVTNINFIGRTRTETSRTIGDADWSNIQTGSFEMEGFSAQLNRLSSPGISITHDTTPTVFGEINRPTPPRLIAHLCTVFNTLSNVCSMMFTMPFQVIGATVNTDATVTMTDTSFLLPGMAVSGTGIPGGATVLSITNTTTFELSANATATGSPVLTFTPETDDNAYITKSITITETSAGSACTRVAGYINARLNHAASGEIEVRRDAFYRDSSDKAGLNTMADITAADRMEYGLSLDYVQKVGQAFTGAEMFNTSTGLVTYFNSSAPPTARGNGEGQASLPGLILTADHDQGDAITELNTATAALYAVSQPVDKLEVIFYDSWRGILIPHNAIWWTFTIASTDNNSGRIYSSSQRWILDSVTISLNIQTGQVENHAVFLREPTPGSAQVQGAVVPDVVVSPYNNLPAMNPYPAFDLNGLINYPTDTPSIDDLQPFNANDAYQANSPYPPEVAADAAHSFPPPGCKSYGILLNDSTGITTPSTTGAATYTVRVTGSGQIAVNGWSTTNHFTSGQHGWAVLNTPNSQARGVYTGGAGYELVTIGAPDPDETVAAIAITLTSCTVTGISVTYTVDVSAGDAGVTLQASAHSVVRTVTTTGLHTSSYTGNFTGTTVLAIALNAPAFGTGTGGSGTITSVTVTGTGTPPPELEDVVASTVVDADAFYYYDPANVNEGFPYTGFGLTFDGNPPNTLPPYNVYHKYDTTVTGTGSPMAVKFSDTDYSDNVASPLNVQMCGSGF